MLQYILTALAGIALGVVGMRLWTTNGSTRLPAGDDIPTSPVGEGAPRFAKLNTPRNLLLGAGALALAGAAVMTLRTGPDGSATGAVSASSPGSQPGATSGLADVDTMISRLEARLKANPKDGDGFRMLGWSQMMTGHPDRALDPYRKAMALLPRDASVQEGYGEALTAVAGGKVTTEAKAAFDKALSLDPAEPRARYFTGKWLAQQGKAQEALDLWIALANSGAADAPWQADVRRDIVETAGKLGVDVGNRLKTAAAITPAGSGMPAIDPATADAANRMPAGERDKMIAGMVERLATRLRANPADPDGWVRLMRSRLVLHQNAEAGADLITARKALTGNRESLATIEAAARELGVPGAH